MDEQLKQRLVGAIVLVSLGVIFIPMLLSPAPEAPPADGSEAPGTDTRPSFNSTVIPVGESEPTAAAPDPPPVPASPPVPVPAAAPAPAPVARAATPAPPAAPAAPSARPAAPATPPAREPVPASGFVVQLGSFANERNANALSAKLVESGHRAFVKTASSSRGTVTRVYVGPTPTRESATQAVEALEKETGLRGMVVRLR